MLPLLPFAAGLLAGGVAVRLLRNVKARAGLEKAQAPLCATAIPGPSAIETPPPATKRRRPAAGGSVAEAAPAAAPPQRAPRKKTAAPRKSAKKTGELES